MTLIGRINFADAIELGRRGWEHRRVCNMEPSDYYPCADDDCMRLSMRMWTCSECEADHVGIKPKYCPNCGAKVLSS